MEQLSGALAYNSSMGLILVLDDDSERLAGFRAAHARLGGEHELRTWSSAPRMIADLERWLSGARLVSLDHDLYKTDENDADLGTGRMVADFLAQRPPACPAIVHSTNTDAAWGMHNVLSRARWQVEIVHHLNEPSWIEDRWLPVARRLLAGGGTAAADVRPVFPQAAVVAWHHIGEEIEVLLVARNGGEGWTLPKGGVEPGLTAAESACREAWEEAGVSGVIAEEPLGEYRYAKWDGECAVIVFAMSVVVHHEHWPERAERERRWFSPAAAAAALCDSAARPFIAVLQRRLGV